VPQSGRVVVVVDFSFFVDDEDVSVVDAAFLGSTGDVPESDDDASLADSEPFDADSCDEETSLPSDGFEGPPLRLSVL
jgi:hypothetical protein